MGNASSSGSRGHNDESVDYGSLVPQGVYTGPRDWNHAIVSQLIIARRLAPFYRPLEEFESGWDDDQILAARKEPSTSTESTDHTSRSELVHTISSKSSHSKRSVPSRDQLRPEAAVYRGAVECPICFLYYPPNINHSRCCDQAICTECFVQIKRNEPTTTHLVSEPAACPYCVQDNFGVVYRPPHWRAGIGSDGSTPSWPEPPRESAQPPTHKRRQHSYSVDSPEVVTTDQIRPDWEAKLAAVRAAVARRANRRIIMRQVGDRLIPVGVSSGRVHALDSGEAGAEAAEGGGGSRRRRRGGANSHIEHLMSIPGQDLEEIMLMEAMRLSLIEHEEHQRKEADERRKREAAAAAAAAAEGGASNEGGPAGGPTPQPAAVASSTLATPPSNSSTIPASSQVSLAPVSASPASAVSGQSQSNESDTGQQQQSKPPFNSQSRPSPPSNSHSESLNGSESVSTSLNQRVTSNRPPPPFSALNAALASASTAAAILGPPLPRQSQETATTTTTTIPTSTVGNAHMTPSTSALDTNGNNDEQDQPPALPPKSTPTATTNTSSSSLNPRDASERHLEELSYGPLPSSPESAADGVVNEPLLAAIKKKDGGNAGDASLNEVERSASGESGQSQDGPTPNE
ncbi:hypothetical protein D9756_001900 [Leucocoprinus leucothites]|uniref:RING-type domain-containing protein n=1 Tax=Leucocoprinus leucothites TaxID=201217 RepID=A0A8H5G517_9AGAR|nr:hypothetical protein D9756_001900 [Leucoagaricus leucothites]